MRELRGNGRARVLLALTLVVAMLATFGLTGCTKKLTAEEYEAAATQALKDLTEVAGSSDETFEGLDELEFDEPLGKENLAAIQDAYDQLYTDFAKIRDDFKKNTPPDEYAEAHEDFMAGLDGMVAYVDVFREMFADVSAEDTLEDLYETLSEGSEDAYADAADAFEKMQSAAEELGIEDELEDLDI